MHILYFLLLLFIYLFFYTPELHFNTWLMKIVLFNHSVLLYECGRAGAGFGALIKSGLNTLRCRAVYRVRIRSVLEMRSVLENSFFNNVTLVGFIWEVSIETSLSPIILHSQPVSLCALIHSHCFHMSLK